MGIAAGVPAIVLPECHHFAMQEVTILIKVAGRKKFQSPELEVG